MKFNKLGLAGALCAVGLLGNTSALALDTSVVPVTATVTGTCKFLTAGSIAFTLDQNATTDASGTVSNPTFWCTKGSTYTVTDNSGANALAGARRMKNTTIATEFIPYSFAYTTTGLGTGKTTPITLTLSAATITNANYVNAAAGSYADSVTLTINP